MAVTIHKATRSSLGRVVRGDEVTETDAVREYAADNDVVVWGGTTAENRALAQRIANAVGPDKRQIPYAQQAGPYYIGMKTAH